MDQRQAIRALLDSLPLPMKQRIERQGAIFRAQRPLNIRELYQKVLDELKEKSVHWKENEAKRLALLKQLNEENPEDEKVR